MLDKTILDKIYSLSNVTNKNNFIVENTNIEPFISLSKLDKRNIELIQLPEIVEKENRGSCYDQTFLVKSWIEKNNIQTRVFFSVTTNIGKVNDLYVYNRNVTSHVFLLSFIDEKWKWIEWSWLINKNNHFDNQDINEVLRKYKQTAERSWHNPIKLFEVKNIILPIPRLYFMNNIMNTQEILV